MALLKKIALGIVLVASAVVSQASVISSGLSSSSYSDSGNWNGYTAESAFNGGSWNSGWWGTAWLQVDLGSVQDITGISFVINQVPNGVSWDKVFVSNTSIGNSWTSLTEVASRNDYASMFETKNLNFNAVGRYLQVVVNGGDSWTAIGDLKVHGVDASVPESSSIALLMLGIAGLAARRFASK